ncbi:putative nuclease HARBI1 [Cucumis melo var. makuwa]|uniref:Nuclease HARBI1 n=1 Tax=Cucumis melo var. makuwa TaxID=1194695 RepID=A0A5D3CQ36_CUCMM|nr:putative nuclease HARBI1 [Cucumis melo var. makuwa]TYK13901.1 putative nuclease HARBI1 [Cucumis melo var. makuwa]
MLPTSGERLFDVRNHWKCACSEGNGLSSRTSGARPKKTRARMPLTQFSRPGVKSDPPTVSSLCFVLAISLSIFEACTLRTSTHTPGMLPDTFSQGYYYLVDVGYPNAEGFLTPYRGQRYHLQKRHGAENAPSTSKEFFTMKHSSAHNVIERAFDVLKGRWTILQAKSHYPVKVQCHTILTCCLLHNLINREMTTFDIVDDIDEVDSTHATSAADDIHYIETSNEWTRWRDDLAKEMFSEWELRN